MHLHISEEDSRLCDADIKSTFGVNGLVKSHVVKCGPDSLILSMTKSVRSLGARYVHHEAFDIRTGIGPDLSENLDEFITHVRHR